MKRGLKTEKSNLFPQEFSFGTGDEMYLPISEEIHLLPTQKMKHFRFGELLLPLPPLRKITPDLKRHILSTTPWPTK